MLPDVLNHILHRLVRTFDTDFLGPVTKADPIPIHCFLLLWYWDERDVAEVKRAAVPKL